MARNIALSGTPVIASAGGSNRRSRRSARFTVLLSLSSASALDAGRLFHRKGLPRVSCKSRMRHAPMVVVPASALEHIMNILAKRLHAADQGIGRDHEIGTGRSPAR